MLTIKNFTKTYPNGKKAVDDLSLTINSGNIYGFVGANGAGKTTTIKAVVGIHDFDKGEITIDGKNIKSEPLSCKKVLSYIPDNPDLYEHLTGMQFINFISDLYEVPLAQRKLMIRKYGDMFEMTPHLGNVISSYCSIRKINVVKNKHEIWYNPLKNRGWKSNDQIQIYIHGRRKSRVKAYSIKRWQGLSDKTCTNTT